MVIEKKKKRSLAKQHPLVKYSQNQDCTDFFHPQMSPVVHVTNAQMVGTFQLVGVSHKLSYCMVQLNRSCTHSLNGEKIWLLITNHTQEF